MDRLLSAQSKSGEGAVFFVRFTTDTSARRSKRLASVPEENRPILSGARVLSAESGGNGREIVAPPRNAKNMLVDRLAGRQLSAFSSGAVTANRMPLADGCEITRATARTDAVTVPILP